VAPFRESHNDAEVSDARPQLEHLGLPPTTRTQMLSGLDRVEERIRLIDQLAPSGAGPDAHQRLEAPPACVEARCGQWFRALDAHPAKIAWPKSHGTRSRQLGL
jgi:hypothetical protein